MLERDVEPGTDYALTEVVHCKSKSEIGVREAEDFCASRYFSRIVSVSGARIIVVLGKPARKVFETELGFPKEGIMHGPTRLSGRERIVTFLPHPNARGPRTFAKCVPENKLETIRAFLSHNN